MNLNQLFEEVLMEAFEQTDYEQYKGKFIVSFSGKGSAGRRGSDCIFNDPAEAYSCLLEYGEEYGDPTINDQLCNDATDYCKAVYEGTSPNYQKNKSTYKHKKWILHDPTKNKSQYYGD